MKLRHGSSELHYRFTLGSVKIKEYNNIETNYSLYQIDLIVSGSYITIKSNPHVNLNIVRNWRNISDKQLLKILTDTLFNNLTFEDDQADEITREKIKHLENLLRQL